MEFLQWLNDNAGAVQAISTFALVVVTIYYAVTSRKTAKLLESDFEARMAVQVDAHLVVKITQPGPLQQNHAFLWVGNLSSERSIQVLALHLTPSYPLKTDEKNEPFHLLVGPNTEEVRDVQQIIASHCRAGNWMKFRISYRAIGDDGIRYTKPRCYSIQIQGPQTAVIQPTDCAELEKAVNRIPAGADEQD